MLRHYVELKAAHPERVLLYRLGDFFECFFEDALLTSRLLELTLTGKEGGKSIGRVPMAGIPHHAAERYCSELVRRGHAVALCDQLETTAAKGALLKRDITRVLTPGTVLEEGCWRPDATTGSQLLCSMTSSAGDLLSLMFRRANCCCTSAKEPLSCNRNCCNSKQPNYCCLASKRRSGAPMGSASPNSPALPLKPPAPIALSSSALGFATWRALAWPITLARRAAGGLIAYLDASQPGSTVPLERPQLVFAGDALVLDHQTRRNLELTATQRDGQFQGSLLWAIDRSHTAMGGRALRRWLEAPLLDATAIRGRQDAIAELVEHRPLRLSVRRLLRPMADLERLAGRCGAGRASARDLVALADGLERLPLLADLLKAAAPLHSLICSNPDLICSNWPSCCASNWWISHRCRSVKAA